ncbi:MAG: VCBS repeat-containing protein [Pirellulales bacterium]|nr:VCBS repeat-containing protein [Pirellulales bacterium]
MRRAACLCLLLCCFSELATSARGDDKKPVKISFKKSKLDHEFRSEGVAVGDFNHDGKQDIAAANMYFAAPDWKAHPIVDKPETFNPAVYSHSFCNFADDLNGDGWDDLIVCDFPGQQTWWFENPQSAAGAWKKHECVPVTNNESPTYLDVDGDGRRELVFADGTPAIALASPAAKPADLWKIRQIGAPNTPGTNKFSHGLGVGDVNADGRNDLLCNEAWWEAPADNAAGEWKMHPANLSQLCANMYVYDFDGDGDNDILSSSAHAFGIWWHEQTPDGWKEHEIDSSFSQTHSLCFADINSDGLPDFVTGKRWWAHGAKGDPGSDQPAVMYWFEFSREGGKPRWTPHQFDHDSGVGTQFEVADINGDGLLDVATSNKKGTHYFEQVRE